MSYTKQNFVSGAILYASELNAMDDMIGSIDGILTDVVDALQFTGDTESYFLQTLRPLLYEKKKMICVKLNSTFWKWDHLYIYSGTNCAYAKYDVEPGKTYFITGSSHNNSAEYPLILLFNSSGINIGVEGTDKATIYTDYEFTCPADVYHIVVNKAQINNKEIIVKEKYPSVGIPLVDEITSKMIGLESRVADVEDKVDEGNAVQPGNPLQQDSYGSGLWDIKTNAVNTSAVANGLYAVYTVEPGNYYFATCDCSGNPNNWPGGAFYDADDVLIETFCDRNDYTRMETTLIKTPLDCVKIIMNRAYTNMPIILRKGFVASKDTGSVAVNSYSLDIAATLLRQERRNLFKMKPYPSGYLSFVFDDLWTDLDSVASLFEQYGYPLCVSAIPDNLGRTGDGLSTTRGNFTPGMNMLDIVNQIVANGGEVFAHNTEVIGYDEDRFNYDFMYNYYIETKKTLESNGFKIRGLISSGGTAHDGSAVARGTEEQNLWLIGNYEYGSGGSLPQYSTYTQRTTINQSVEDIKAVILDAYTNHKWIPFMCHSYTFGGGITFTGESDLIEILDYIDSLQIPVVTYAYMFDHYGSTEFEERLSALEANI